MSTAFPRRGDAAGKRGRLAVAASVMDFVARIQRGRCARMRLIYAQLIADNRDYCPVLSGFALPAGQLVARAVGDRSATKRTRGKFRKAQSAEVASPG